MNPVNLPLLIQAIPRTPAPVDVEPHFVGARVFHAAGETDGLWLAELARFTADSQVLGHNLFVSADGKVFSQLKVTDRQEACILTETPGLGWALTVYDDTNLHLFVGKPENPRSAVRFGLQRIPARDLLGAAVFYGLPPGPL